MLLERIKNTLLVVCLAITAFMSYSVSSNTVRQYIDGEPLLDIVDGEFLGDAINRFDGKSFSAFNDTYHTLVEWRYRASDKSIVETNLVTYVPSEEGINLNLAIHDPQVVRDHFNLAGASIPTDPDPVIPDPIEPVEPDPIDLPPVVVCDPYAGTSKVRVNRRLETFAFIFDENTTKAQANQAIGRLFDDEADSRARNNALLILVNGCPE